ncbi:MAG: dihydroorotase [Candidatus Omnitrophota bacterium]
MKILIKNGRVIDPGNSLDKICDILIQEGIIQEICAPINTKADRQVDATGKIVLPGLVDMHVHLREPGREDKETIESATRAALKGGVTSLLAMPNTEPAMDTPENIRLLKKIIQGSALANVFVTGTITKARKGEELTDIKKIKKEGAIAITDDGNSVDSEGLMLEALKRAKEAQLLLISHAEDKAFSNKGAVNLGIISTRLGLKGISKESEYARVERDIELAQKAGTKIHIAHVSCRESVEIIAKAKKKGIQVSADTCPHYFSLTEDAVLGYDTNFKMNPPLRTREDVQAIREGLASGAIDAISSDHAPHTENEKEIEFERAEFGVVGLETELAASITQLLHSGLLNWGELIEKLSLNPSRILGINKGLLGKGLSADLIIVSPDKEWLVEKRALASKSKNCAFLGQRLKGMVEYTICQGQIAYEASSHQGAGQIV